MNRISVQDLKFIELILFSLLDNDDLTRSDYRDLSNSIAIIINYIHTRYYIY